MGGKRRTKKICDVIKYERNTRKVEDYKDYIDIDVDHMTIAMAIAMQYSSYSNSKKYATYFVALARVIHIHFLNESPLLLLFRSRN